MITIQKYVRPQSLEEAYQLNQNKRNKIIGGMLWLKMANITVPTAIDLCDLGLDTIEENDEEFSIGAYVTLRQLELHSGLNAYTNNSVRHALCDIVGVQFRNMATVGGSIYGRFGFSDVLTVFMAMDTYVELYKGGIIKLKDFAAMNYDRDILVRIIIKKQPGIFSYSAMRASRTDFPIITCALSRMSDGYSAAIGARPGKAILIKDTEHIMSGSIKEDAINDFSDYIASHVPTQSNMRGSSKYRTHLIKVLTKRALTEMEEPHYGN